MYQLGKILCGLRVQRARETRSERLNSDCTTASHCFIHQVTFVRLWVHAHDIRAWVLNWEILVFRWRIEGESRENYDETNRWTPRVPLGTPVYPGDAHLCARQT